MSQSCGSSRPDQAPRVSAEHGARISALSFVSSAAGAPWTRAQENLRGGGGALLLRRQLGKAKEHDKAGQGQGLERLQRERADGRRVVQHLRRKPGVVKARLLAAGRRHRRQSQAAQRRREREEREGEREEKKNVTLSLSLPFSAAFFTCAVVSTIESTQERPKTMPLCVLSLCPAPTMGDS